jgi:co-chaperonin GroES (HSP10)
MMNKVKGKLIPIRDNVLIIDMNFDEEKTLGGIIIPSDDGKAEGVKHRWGKVWAVGPEQKDVKVDDWILLEHGRWTRGITIEDENGNDLVIRRADVKAILMVSDEKPNQVIFGKHSKVQHATIDAGTFAGPQF